jgi:SAM-dependent methyltransferase
MGQMRSENELKFFPIKRRLRLAFRRLAAPRLGGRVADLGAGSSPYQKEAPRCTFVGLDWVRTPAVQVVGSTLELPFKGESFDGAMLTETLEHVPDPSRALMEAARILRPGGYLYFTSPQMWPLHYEPHDYFRFTRYGLTRLAAQAGLEVEAVQPVAGLFTFLLTRVGEKLVKLLVALLGWLPRPRRWQVAGFLSLPALWTLYGLALLLDRAAPRDVLGWAVLARKPEGPLSGTE